MAKKTSFPSRVRHIQKNEPVSAGVASRPDRTMEGRTNYLKEVVDTIEAGRALVLRDQAVNASALVGQPVYWDSANQEYAQAQAGVENDTSSGMLVATEASDVTGLLWNKKAGNRGDIVIWGVVSFDELSNAIDDSPIDPGRYYLSATDPGKMVKQRPPATVSVCLVFGPLDACDEKTWVFVMPQMRDFLEDHIHYSFSLTARPAGDHTSPAVGSPHVITSADANKKGWLPAGHASFNGKAPTGAKFGYNLSAHPELDQLWPPIPASAALLEMRRPSIYNDVKGTHVDAVLDFPSVGSNSFEELTVSVPGATPDDSVIASPEGGPTSDGVIQAWVSSLDTVTVRYTNPTGGAINPPSTTYHIQVLHDPDQTTSPTAVAFHGLERVPSPQFVVIDTNGIWWMTDCYNEVPWPTDLETGLSSSSVSAVSESSESAADCPVDDVMSLIFSFIKMTFATDKTVVTSLQPEAGQPLQYVNCDGDEANTGDLFSRLVLQLLIDPDEYLGGQALKNIGTDNRFQRGYVTEGLIAGSSNVSLTSTRSRLQDPTQPAGSGNPTVHQEIVTVDVNLDPTERELLPQIVVLGDAVERTYKNIPYIGLPDGRDSGVRVKFVVPPEGLPTTPKLKIRVVIFGRGDGTMTDLDTSYYRFVRPTTGTPTPVAEGDTALTLATNIAVLADEAHEIESAEITVAAGDTVFVSLDRLAAGTPVYDFEMGLIRIGGVIVPGS